MKFLYKTSTGQAAVEYLLLTVFLVTLSINVVGGFTDFMSGTIGGLGHVLSGNLSVGVCREECFFSGYKNGFNSQ